MPVEAVALGCRLNGVEADTMRRDAEAAGFDGVVVNTCAVTAEAVRQSRQAIRRLGRERPGTAIVATGCAVQLDPPSFASLPGVRAVLGNREKMQPGWPGRLSGEPCAAVGDVQAGAGPVRAASDAGLGRVRAFVRIQTGCDHRCTFCVIPLGRGPSRSAPLQDVIAAVREAVEAGAREVVLTGVDSTAYDHGGARLGTLVRAVLRAVPDLPRLRLSSIDGVEADPDLLAALAEEPRLMPHIHLSLQSGDDLVLRRMKRRHSRADAVRVCAELRRLRPDVELGADLIAGFPTETEAMFARSLDLIEACGLTYLHVFPYSPRPGTPAARMPRVEPEAVRDRARRLREAGAAALARRLAAEVGVSRPVLVETETLGRTEGFAPVRFASPRRRGDLALVRIAGATERELLAA